MAAYIHSAHGHDIDIDCGLKIASDMSSVDDDDDSNGILSIIVCCYNESEYVEQFLLYLERHCYDRTRTEVVTMRASTSSNSCYILSDTVMIGRRTEVVFVDDGSTDVWWSKLPPHNPRLSKLITIPTKLIKQAQHRSKGRGMCHRIGVQYCHPNTKFLLFLSMHNVVCDMFDITVRRNLSDSNVVCGAFRFAFDCNHMTYPMPGFAVLQWRTRLDEYLCCLPCEDGGFFVSTKMYAALDGIPAQCILERYAFMRKARFFALQHGKRIHIDDTHQIFVSPKKYYQSGKIW
eukprot:CAMPEP_0202729290 /NCGR_PEP_ID=MMETSP1385-20130828/186056_1 /ASSEMBLY_ACC=CAM_ASM_000861 /TAXON_ID=933848 /ORGANISM="Elphidium margaritaceum" /LENGTH=289 /DNA_ID=CAMNT_0049395549 /DNA_START=233 /DNA_END=1098 /DNA_ORIENTATION=-